ncbi:DUF4214 domain-containing protein [Duganella sp. CY15W]|uniref:DUF4214 domain-containing protein n=1 Tax=Duganella sp. CY15W TaxID=2692172 RepID=UPI001E57AADE|nr:DUF4214 domain-containing protein [Duganella sp. CY15W]
MSRIAPDAGAGTDTTIYSYDDANGARTVRLSNGLVTKTTFDATGNTTGIVQYDASGQVLSRIVNAYDDAGLLRKTVGPDGQATYLIYDAAGRQSAKVDANGNLTAYFYNANNQLSRTIQFAQRTDISMILPSRGSWPPVTLIDLDFDTSDVNNRSTWNVYDKAGRLSATVDATGSVTRYKYDQAGRLTQTVRSATIIAVNTLSGAFALDSVADTPSPADLISRNYYDKDGNLQLEVDAAGYVTEYRYDAAGQKIEMLRRATALAANYFAQTPNATASDIITTAGAVATHERYFYNSKNQLAGTLDNGNFLTEIRYDLNGNVLSRRHYATAVKTPGAARMKDLNYAADDTADLLTSYTYTARNQVETETAPGGIVTRYTYNKLGQLMETRVGAGSGIERAQAKRYDIKGNVIAELNAEGSALLAGAQTQADIDSLWLRYGSSYAYSSSGLRISATDANGNKTRYYYDAIGNLRYTVNALGEVTALTYSAFGQLTSKTRFAARIDAATLASLSGGQNMDGDTQRIDSVKSSTLDSTESYEYDGDGHLTATVDALKNRSTTHYDVFGRADITEQQSVAGSNASAPASNPGTRSLYDADGRLSAVLTSSGSLTVYTYNALDQLTDRITYAKPVAFDISADNLKTLVATPAAQSDNAHDLHQRYFYDERGLVKASMTADGLSDGKLQWSVVKNTYDGNGNLLTRTAYATKLPSDNAQPALSYPADSGADSVTAYSYDNANRLVMTATAQKAPDPAKPTIRNWALVRNSYDAIGNLVLVTAYAKAKAGLLPSTAELNAYADTSSADAVTCYTYDSANRIKTVATAQSTTTVNQVATTLWSVTERFYDGLGQLQKSTQYAAAGQSAVGAVLKTAPAADSARDRTTAFEYDAAGRLTTTTDAEGGKTVLAYDTKGNIVQRTALGDTRAEDRSTRLYYDLDNRLQYSVDAAGSVTEQRYDALGNLAATVRYAKQVNPDLLSVQTSSLNGQLSAGDNDRTERYIYDRNHRLVYTVDALGYLTEKTYDAFGRVATTLSYPTAAALSGFTVAAAATAKANAGTPRVSSFEYDAAGNLVKSTDALGKSESYTYDALNHKITFTNKLNNTWTYAYDSVGHLLLETAPAVDAYPNGDAGWDTATALPVALKTAMEYDALGNLVTRTEGYGSDRPRVTSYQYDRVGRQTVTTRPAAAVYNTGAALGTIGVAPRSEVDSGPLTVVVSYDMLGNAVSNKDVGGALSFKVYDRLGQVRYDVDALGYLTGYEHDAFGAVTALTRYAVGMDGFDSFKADAAKRTLSFVEQHRGTPAENRTVRTKFDKLGRAIKVIEPMASVYDEHALNGIKYFQAARTTETRYDAFGQARQILVYGADSSGTALTAAASTRYYYDAAGNKKAQIATLQDDASGRKGYLTTFDYNDAGDLLKQTEYESLYGDWQADWKDTRYGLPTPSPAERVTQYTYDNLHRKISEARNGAATSYNYDAVGNTTRVTDATGLSTFSYYNAVGQVTAVARGGSVTPPVSAGAPSYTLALASGSLSEFRRDLFGNVVVQIDVANGAAAGTSEAARPVAVYDRSRDRATVTRYDGGGRVDQVIDAEGKYSYNSYDVYGRVAKQWRTVTNPDNASNPVETSFTVTSYDSLGRVQTVTKPGNIDLVRGNLTPANTVKTYQYNAFGEVKQVDGVGADGKKQSEYTRYDNAGHAWLSNTGDGIDKVSLFDAQGNVSSTLVRTDASLEFGSDLTRSINVEQALGKTGLQRTDFSYDLMGRQIDARRDNEANVFVLERDPITGLLTKYAQNRISSLVDSRLLVSDPSEKEMAKQVSYRLKGSTVWVSEASRLQTLEGYTVFSTRGLSAGDYEYRVTLTPPGESAFVRSQGVVTIVTSPTSETNMQLARVYGMLLNRVPDAIGLNFYVDRANKGESLAHLVLDFLRSTEASVFLGGSSSDAIKRLLLNGFGRDGSNFLADPTFNDEVKQWADAYDQAKAAGGDATGQMMLDMIDAMMQPADSSLLPNIKAAKAAAQARMSNGVTAGLAYATTYLGSNQDSATAIWKSSATSLSTAMAQAQELATNETLRIKIAQCYLALFGRPPEKAGMDFWLQGLKSLSPEEMVGGMLGSPEAKDPAFYPDLGLDDAAYNRQLVNHVYQNLLGRAPTDAELIRWNSVLPGATDAGDQKNVKRGKFVLTLAAEISNYADKDSARLAQKQLFNTKITLALKYATLDLSGVPALDQGAMGAAMFAAVTTGDSAKAAVDKTVATVAANATAAAALSAAANAMAGSTRLEDIRAQITRLYVALLNRTPDSDGLPFQVAAIQRDNGSPAAWIALANNLINSEESRKDSTLTALPPLTDAAFVERVYTLAVGSKPVSAGARQEMAAFVQQLTAGSTRGEVALNIVSGLLTYKELTAEDAALRARFNNKVGVALACAVNLSAFDWGKTGTAARSVLQDVTATDIQLALNNAYDIAKAAYLNSSQPTLDAVAQARIAVDTNAAATAASLQAKSSVDSAQNAAQAQPTAMARLQLMQMYVGILGRTTESYNRSVDLEGLEVQVKQIALPRTMGQIAQSFIDSEEGQKIYGAPLSLTNDQFVKKVYTTILDKQVTLPAADLASWIAQLNGASPPSRGDVAWGILNAVKNYSSTQPDTIASAYLAARQAFFQRVSDCFVIVNQAQQSSAATYAKAKQDQDALAKTVADLLSRSQADEQEKNRLKGIADAASAGTSSATKRRLDLTLMYTTLLQRKEAPKQLELDYYISGDGAAYTIEKAASVFIASADGKSVGYPVDKDGFVDKLYTVILGRSAVQSEKNYWRDQFTNDDDGRGKFAYKLLMVYMNGSDSQPAQLQRKVAFDQLISSFIEQERQAADSIKSSAYSAWWSKYLAADSAQTQKNNADQAVTDTYAVWKPLQDDVKQEYFYAKMFMDARSKGNQNWITSLYLGLRRDGSRDFPGLAFQMANDTGKPEFGVGISGTLLTEPGSNGYWPTDPTQFVRKLLIVVAGRPADLSLTNAEVVATTKYMTDNGLSRGKMAYDMVMTKASSDLQARVARQVTDDLNYALQIIANRNNAKKAYDDAVAAQPIAVQRYTDAANAADIARGTYDIANGKLTATNTLQALFNSIAAADNAISTARQSQDAYLKQKADFDAKQQALNLLADIAANGASDQAGGALALALSAAANADVGQARASIADAASTAASKQVRQVTQLYLTLLGRSPQLAELRFWTGKLSQGNTSPAKLAQNLLQSKEGMALYPASLSNDDFVKQLFNTALNRGFDNDKLGLKFWSQRLSGDNPLSRAELASMFAGSVPTNNNDDSVYFNNKVSATLQQITLAGTASDQIDQAMAKTIQLAEDTARSEAASYDAAGISAAAKVPLTQYTQPLTRLYLAMLNRAPDLAGMQFWVDALTRSQLPLTLQRVANDMLAAPESQARYQQLSDSDFLTQVYTNAMGYAPAAGALTPYLAQIAANGRGAAALTMLNAIVDAPSSSSLQQIASRNAFIAKADQALATVAVALTNQARYLSEAGAIAQALAATNPVEQHVDGVVWGIASSIKQGGKNLALPTLTLDRWGNVTKRLGAQDPNWAISYTYNANNQLLTMTQQQQLNEAPKYAQQISYDAAGRTLTVTEGAADHISRNYYDVNGNLLREQHADGGIIDYQLDNFGQRTAIWQYRDATSIVKTDYGYDRLGRQTSRTSAAVDTYYWMGGNDTSLKSAVGRSTDSYFYDELGRQIRSTSTSSANIADPNNGLSTLTRYDLSGNVISTESGAPANRALAAPRNALVTAYDAFNFKVAEQRVGVSAAGAPARYETKYWEVDDHGRIKRYTDLSGVTTTYGYDTAGRLSNQFRGSGAQKQNLIYTYDNGTGLLLRIEDKVTDQLTGVETMAQVTDYRYDHAGRRITEKIWQVALNRALQDNTLSYDHRSRLTDIVSKVPGAAYQVHYEYDDYGNRKHVRTHFFNDVGDEKDIVVDYGYDNMNRLTSVSGSVRTSVDTPAGIDNPNQVTQGPIDAHAIAYDWLGNRITDNKERYEYDNAGRLWNSYANDNLNGTRQYDGAGRVITNLDRDGTHYNSYDTLGRMAAQRNVDSRGNQVSKLAYYYDTAGNLERYTVTSADNKNTQTITMQYMLRDGYLLTETRVANSPTDSKSSIRHYDRNGNLYMVTGEDERLLYTDSNGRILEKNQKNVVTHSLFANGELIGSSSKDFESFSSVYESANSPEVATPPSVYVVQGTEESPRSIAKMLWGDERLWYLIADVNPGISGADTKLTAGTVLKTPTRINTVLNGYQSFKPYNQNDALGSTTPTLAMPAAPQGGGGGCGVAGKIISVVVAVAVTIFTGNPALGSIASQLFNMATGQQKSFNWKAVALSELAAGMTQGVNMLADAGTLSSALTDASSNYVVAARAAIANVATQAVASVTGLQSFNWAGVAAAAVGAGVGAAVSDALNGTVLFDTIKLNNFAKASLTGFAAGTATAVARGGRISTIQIATDAFGNALGRSLAESINDYQTAARIEADQMRSGREEAEFEKANFVRTAGNDNSSAGSQLSFRESVQAFLEAQNMSFNVRDGLYNPGQDDADFLQIGGVRGGGRGRMPVRWSSEFEFAMNGRQHNLLDAFSNLMSLGDYQGIKSEIGLAGEWMRHTARGEIIEGIRTELTRDGYSPPELGKRYLPELSNPLLVREVPNYSSEEIDNHIEYTRRVALANQGAVTLGKDLSIETIGKDRMKPNEFLEKLTGVYQNAVDRGSSLAKTALDAGNLFIPPKLIEKFGQENAERIMLGNATDRFAKGAAGDFLIAQKIPEGAYSVVALGRKFSDSLNPMDYRVPDILVRYSSKDIYAIDATLGVKTSSTAQVRDTLRYGAKSWTNISPYQPPTTIYAPQKVFKGR